VKFTSELRDATCQWDHTVLSATRQRWPPRLHPNQASWYSIYRPCKDERLSWPSWLVTYRDGWPVHKRSPIQVLTGSDVAQVVDRGQRTTTKPNRRYGVICIENWSPWVWGTTIKTLYKSPTYLFHASDRREWWNGTELPLSCSFLKVGERSSQPCTTHNCLMIRTLEQDVITRHHNQPSNGTHTQSTMTL